MNIEEAKANIGKPVMSVDSGHKCTAPEKVPHGPYLLRMITKGGMAVIARWSNEDLQVTPSSLTLPTEDQVTIFDLHELLAIEKYKFDYVAGVLNKPSDEFRCVYDTQPEQGQIIDVLTYKGTLILRAEYVGFDSCNYMATNLEGYHVRIREWRTRRYSIDEYHMLIDHPNGRHREGQ